MEHRYWWHEILRALRYYDCNGLIVGVMSEDNHNVDMFDQWGSTLLMRAACHGRLKSIETLSRYGADKDAVNALGNSALMIAAGNNKYHTVSLLLELGADPFIVNNNGQTALTIASECGHYEIMNVLIKAMEK